MYVRFIRPCMSKENMQLNGNFIVFSFLPPKATSQEERKKDFDKIFNHYDVVSMLLNSLGADDFFFFLRTYPFNLFDP